MRKVIQIAVWESDPLAVCADGSVWWFSRSRQTWTRLPNIPQDAPAADAVPVHVVGDR